MNGMSQCHEPMSHWLNGSWNWLMSFMKPKRLFASQDQLWVPPVHFRYRIYFGAHLETHTGSFGAFRGCSSAEVLGRARLLSP